MSEANWYVVHTYSGYENKVKANIEKTIENRKLQDQILEVTVPMQDVVEVKNGAKKQVSKKMFPGYVLINMIMNDDTWYVVRNTRGVTGFVGPGSKPVPLTEAEMKPLGIKVDEVVVDFDLGDTVTVTSGVWEAKLMQVVHKVQQRLNSDLSIAGVLITQYDGRKNLNKSVSELVQETFQGKVFSTHIRNAITLAEAPTQGQDIFHYAPKSAGAEDYEKVCNELLTEIK